MLENAGRCKEKLRLDHDHSRSWLCEQELHSLGGHRVGVGGYYIARQRGCQENPYQVFWLRPIGLHLAAWFKMCPTWVTINRLHVTRDVTVRTFRNSNASRTLWFDGNRVTGVTSLPSVSLNTRNDGRHVAPPVHRSVADRLYVAFHVRERLRPAWRFFCAAMSRSARAIACP